MIQLVAAANHAIIVKRVILGFHGVNAAHEPILVEILKQTDAGTAAALTLVKADDNVSDTLDTTAQKTFTVEPAAGDILAAFPLHPQSMIVLPIEDIIVGAAERIGIRATAPNAVNADITVEFEE
jgi:hypothetical protein